MASCVWPGLSSLQLLQFRVLRLGLDEDGDIGVGILPQGKEVLVGGARLGGIALERVGARQPYLGQWMRHAAEVNELAVEYRLEFGGGGLGVLLPQVINAAHVVGLDARFLVGTG